MTIIETILNFITDKTKRISTRAAVIIIVILMVLLIDNVTGFSYYYNKERQIEQLKSVTSLLKDNSIDTEIKKELLILQKQSLKRENWIDASITFIKNTTFKNSNLKLDSKSEKPLSLRNDYWFLASSSGLYILVLIVLLPILLFLDKSMGFIQRVGTVIIFALVMLFTAWFNFWLFDKIIPDELFGSWTWNYIINSILQIGLVTGLYWASNNMNKASTV